MASLSLSCKGERTRKAKLLMESEYDRKLAVVREKLIYASELNGLAHDLATGRPIGGKAWNSFIKAICAKNDEDYVELLLDVASEVTKELNPSAWDNRRLERLRKVSRDRTYWPMMVSRGTAGIIEAKRLADLLELGNNDGRKRKSAKPEAVALLSEDILKLLRTEIESFHLPTRFPRAKWSFYYICESPPQYTKSKKEIWQRLAGEVLDIYYGPRSVRDTARATHLEYADKNRPLIPQYQTNSLTALWSRDKERRGRDLQLLLTAWRKWDKSQRDILKRKRLRRWPDEPPPFALSYPMLQDFGGKSKNGEARSFDRLKSPEAAYNQLKKDVLEAVANRLPK